MLLVSAVNLKDIYYWLTEMLNVETPQYLNFFKQPFRFSLISCSYCPNVRGKIPENKVATFKLYDNENFREVLNVQCFQSRASL